MKVHSDDNENSNITIPVPKMMRKKWTDVVPSTLMVCQSVQQMESKRLMRVLLDSGGSYSLIHARMLPKGANPVVLSGTRNVKTIMG